jgi:hypothetical protein
VTTTDSDFSRVYMEKETLHGTSAHRALDISLYVPSFVDAFLLFVNREVFLLMSTQLSPTKEYEVFQLPSPLVKRTKYAHFAGYVILKKYRNFKQVPYSLKNRVMSYLELNIGSRLRLRVVELGVYLCWETLDD